MKLLTVLMIPCVVFANDITINIKGLVCPTCAIGIKKNFIKTKKVESVKLDIKNQQAHVTELLSYKLTNDEIVKAVKAAGYEIAIKDIIRNQNERFN